MNYNQAMNGFSTKIGEAKKFVLATSLNDRPTARMMSCIIINNAIYFQTDKQFTKYEQISQNSTVALCIDNIQIEGIAQECGHPLEETNQQFAKLFEKYYSSSFRMYTHLPNEVVFKVRPTKITLWEYENGKPYRIFIDCENQTAAREDYEI